MNNNSLNNNSWKKGFLAGLLIAGIFFAGLAFVTGGDSGAGAFVTNRPGTVAYASGRLATVTAFIDGMLHMTFNGTEFKPAEADGSAVPVFLYNNRTYLPVRAVSEKAGVYVDYEDETAEVKLKSENELLNKANLVLHYLKYRDFAQLASLAHENKGVKFSPYAYVEDNAVTLSAAALKTLNLADEYEWGAYDGSGEPMILKTGDFFNRYIYDKDYIQAPRIGINSIIQQGNTLINLDEAFPGASFVEYNFPSPETGADGSDWSIDWSSLRLVFEKSGGEWKLAGVVHDCWTI